MTLVVEIILVLAAIPGAAVLFVNAVEMLGERFEVAWSNDGAYRLPTGGILYIAFVEAVIFTLSQTGRISVQRARDGVCTF